MGVVGQLGVSGIELYLWYGRGWLYTNVYCGKYKADSIEIVKRIIDDARLCDVKNRCG